MLGPKASAAVAAFAAVMLVVQPADSERQPEPVAASQVPVKTVKTVVIPLVAKASAAAKPAPARPLLPLTALTVAPPSKTIEPIRQGWEKRLAAAQQKAVELDGDDLTSSLLNEERFAALPVAPIVAVPALPLTDDAPSAEDADEPSELGRKTRMRASANLRARPASGGKFLRTLNAGTSVSLIGCRGGWCEVSAEGRRGFVAERFLNGRAAPSAKRKKASRKEQPKQVSAKEAQAESKDLPGVFPQPGVSAPSNR